MKRVTLFVVVGVFGVYVPLAQGGVDGMSAIHWQLFSRPTTGDSGATAILSPFDCRLNNTAGRQQVEPSAVPAQKSKTVAVLMSVVIPGSGEIYCGSYLKGIGFLLVESACWVVSGVYRKEGQEIEDEFHRFADTHWFEDRYWDWIALESDIDRNDMEALRTWERGSFSHSLHEEKDQQYYEMIGKYDQFNIGWDDTTTPFARDSERRDHYETRRDASNKAFKTAATGEMIVLANHVLSALDAAWTVSRYNNRVVQTSLRITPSRHTWDHAPMLTLRVNW